jgi:ATP-dependent protease ClpP protease subunit
VKNRPLAAAMASAYRPKALTPPPGLRPRQQGKPYAIKALANDTSEIYIYDEISWWGITAQDFIDELRDISTGNIELHVNTPGGDVYDGIAIYNAIRNHPAFVTGIVDAMAASAGSFIIQACDVILMEPTAELLIHDAHVGVFDYVDAQGLQELYDDLMPALDRVSNNIAGIYATRAGGTVESWRAKMRPTNVYTAEAAVKVGLADAVRVKADATENTSKVRPTASASTVDDGVFNVDPALFREAVLGGVKK